MIPTRQTLIDLFEGKIKEYSAWKMADSAYVHINIGICLSFLKANVPYRLLTDHEYKAETGISVMDEGEDPDPKGLVLIFPEISKFAKIEIDGFNISLNEIRFTNSKEVF